MDIQQIPSRLSSQPFYIRSLCLNLSLNINLNLNCSWRNPGADCFDTRQLAQLWHPHRDRREVEASIQSSRGSGDGRRRLLETCRWNRQRVQSDIQSKLKNSIDQKNACLRHDFEDASYEVLLAGWLAINFPWLITRNSLLHRASARTSAFIISTLSWLLCPAFSRACSDIKSKPRETEEGES